MTSGSPESYAFQIPVMLMAEEAAAARILDAAHQVARWDLCIYLALRQNQESSARLCSGSLSRDGQQ